MNHELRNWIVANGLATAEPADVLSRLNEQVEVHRDSQRWTLSGVLDVLDLELVLSIEHKLKAAGLNVFLQAMISGVQFDAPNTRSKLLGTVAMGILTQQEVDTLLAIGLRFGPAWEKAGMTACPTVEDIISVQATIATEEVRERLAQRINLVRSAVDAGELLTWDAVRNALGQE